MMPILFSTAISLPPAEISCASPAFSHFSAWKWSHPIFISPVFSRLLRGLILLRARKSAPADVAEGQSGAVQSP
jgi:hypothetical protein